MWNLSNCWLTDHSSQANYQVIATHGGDRFVGDNYRDHCKADQAERSVCETYTRFTCRFTIPIHSTSNKRVVVVVVILIIGKRVSISLPTKNFFTFNDRETTWVLGEERPTNERVIKWSLTLVVGYNTGPYQWPIIFLKACHVSFKGCHNLGEIISLRFEYNSKLISNLL